MAEFPSCASNPDASLLLQHRGNPAIIRYAHRNTMPRPRMGLLSPFVVRRRRSSPDACTTKTASKH